MVHPGLLGLENKATAVEIDRCFEVFSVAVAANTTLDRHDLAVDSFGYSIRNPVSTVADHVGKTLLDRLGHFSMWR